MLDMNILIKRIKRRIPQPIFDAVDMEFFIEILMEETLPFFSEYYPKNVKGIVVTKDMGINTVNPSQRVKSTAPNKYVIPMVDDITPYSGISTFHYPGNVDVSNTNAFAGSGLASEMAGRMLSTTNNPTISFTANFESPNIIEISPAPFNHIDFTVSLHRLRRLEEIKSGYHDIVKRLYEADVKIALYYKFSTISEGGTFGGVELQTLISEFKDYENTRIELTTEFEEDYWLDTDRIDEMLNYSPGTQWIS